MPAFVSLGLALPFAYLLIIILYDVDGDSVDVYPRDGA